MKRGKAANAAICVSMLLTATAFLILLSPAGPTSTGAGTPVVQLGVNSRIIAEHPLVEIVEAREFGTRVWERVREVEITYPDGRKERRFAASRVLEKGSGICYRDASGGLVPAVPEWEITMTAFAVERCVYRLYAGATLSTPLTYFVEGSELRFRPAASQATRWGGRPFTRPTSVGQTSAFNSSTARARA
jgi:hypothetical protein